jgi:hypothetical protein
MKMSKKTFQCLLLAVCCVLLTACDRGGLERAVVAGKVTYQGQPVADGRIRFVPIKGTKAPMWGANIRDGEYEASGRGGVPVGTHRVEIVAWRTKSDAAETTKSPKSDQIMGGAPGQQYIPEKYNTKSELEIIIPPGSGEIVRDFDLTE